MKEIILEKTYSVGEAAKILKRHPLTVRRKIADRSLAHYRLGGKIEIGESHLKQYVAHSEVKAGEAK
jgi:excisionase family DNA binding protein